MFALDGIRLVRTGPFEPETQREIVARVGVPQRLLLGDPPRLDELEQRLVEGLGNPALTFLPGLLDLIDLAVAIRAMALRFANDFLVSALARSRDGRGPRKQHERRGLVKTC